jgi:hypothetical protein
VAGAFTGDGDGEWNIRSMTVALSLLSYSLLISYLDPLMRDPGTQKGTAPWRLAGDGGGGAAGLMPQLSPSFSSSSPSPLT